MSSASDDLHQDVLQQLLIEDPDEIRWIGLKDQLVSCGLRLRALTRRSFDPLVVDIREHLQAAAAPVSLKALGSMLGCPERVGLRVVAEVLHILERTEEVTRDGTGDFTMARVPKYAELRSREQILELRALYVPRSEQLGPDIPRMSEAKFEEHIAQANLPFWDFPDDQELYSPDRLAADIKRVCVRTGQNLLPTIDHNEGRDEDLQRSRLVTTGLRFVGCSVVQPIAVPFWIIHRCYLFRSQISGRHGWNIRVYRYPRGGQQEGYTRHLNDRQRTGSALIEELCDRSEPITL
jgi:hypothetical protein